MTTKTCTACGTASQSARLSITVSLFVSGLFGYLAGVVAQAFYLSPSSASAFAGFVGFMGTEMVSLGLLLWNSRYRRPQE